MARLLIVDDEKNIREVVREYALMSGYEADEAQDGTEAVEMVRKTDYDCVILDIMMPKLDGYTACRMIKEIKPVPVIMLSARSEEYDKLMGFELGVDDYVVKPFSPRELMARVNSQLRRYRRFREVLAGKAEAKPDNVLVVGEQAHDSRETCCQSFKETK